MFDVDEQNLKSKYGNILYGRGLDTYLRNKVRRIDIEVHKEEGGEELLFINALVESSFGSDNYEVEVQLNNRTSKIQCACECRYFHSSNQMCKHAVAVLLIGIEKRLIF
jgi:hypothetical protein